MRLNYEITIIRIIKSIYYNNFIKKQCLSRIENIDTQHEEIIVYIRGIHTPVRLKYVDAVKDKTILGSFSSLHASYIGYCFGLCYLKRFNEYNWNDDWFIISQNESKHLEIQGIDRKGNIIYLDANLQEKFVQILRLK